MSDETAIYVLDSYAIMAHLQSEKGASRVRGILRDGLKGKCRIVLSLINLGEVLYITERASGITRAQEVLRAIEQLPVELLPVSKDNVLVAAHTKAHFRLSYADCFVVAAARALDGVVLTGDPEFRALEDVVRIEWLA